MSMNFNADEVFTMAVRAEENGAAFYRRAAELRPAEDTETITLLRNLADMENEHKATFAAMHKNIGKRMHSDTPFDPYMEATMYLNEMADTHGGEGAPSVADKLTGNESLEDILQTAINLEQNSIIYYLGILDLVPPKLGRKEVENIIAEEKSHIAILVEELRQLRAAGDA